MEAFPYDYVYFKAEWCVKKEYVKLDAFPYDYVYFKAVIIDPEVVIARFNFHTITSILKHPPWMAFLFLQLNFHTITSILKRELENARLHGGLQFPYDYVYFKALSDVLKHVSSFFISIRLRLF